jgi:hypothetical protein
MTHSQWFDFGSTETYWFCRWVRESGEVDVPALIAKAFEAVEGDEWFKMGADTSYIVRDKLADQLEEMLDERATDHGVLWEPSGEPHASFAALSNAVLVAGFDRVDVKTAALALLTDAGKWAPDPSDPEAL